MSSEYIEVQLSDATPKQLRWYLTNTLGIEVVPTSQRQHLVSKLMAAAPDVTSIAVPPDLIGEEAPSFPGAVAKPAVAQGAEPVASREEITDHPRFDPRVELLVLPTADKLRTKNCVVSVNGVQWVLERGKPMAVPYRVYEALNAAVENKWEEVGSDPDTKRPIREMTQSHSYPFQLIRMPTDEEVQAWKDGVSAFEAKREAARVKKAA